MHVTVIGAGYVGLVTGACFAEFGHSIVCVDKDSEKIDRLRKGEIPIYEPGLDMLVGRGLKSGRLAFTTDLAQALEGSSTVFLAVGTPCFPDTGQADLRYVFAAVTEIASLAKDYTLIVTKSTVPVGTAARIRKIVQETNPTLEFDVASNPEFLREGSAVEDFMGPDRVVIGSTSERARQRLADLYHPLALNETPMVYTTTETAEIIKYASNAFLATKVAFINEMADLCEVAGGNVQDVARAMGLDRRIGKKFLHAGPGFGGSCFPKDTRALAQICEALKTPSHIVSAVVASNEKRKVAMVQKILDAFGGMVKGKTLAILGLSFKPNTDDIRESPSLVIIPALLEAGAKIRAYDPAAMENAQRCFPTIIYGKDPYQTCEGAHGTILLTEWNAFKALDLEVLSATMEGDVFIDLRNVYKHSEMRATGFTYISIGRENGACVS